MEVSHATEARRGSSHAALGYRAVPLDPARGVRKAARFAVALARQPVPCVLRGTSHSHPQPPPRVPWSNTQRPVLLLALRLLWSARFQLDSDAQPNPPPPH